MPAACASAMAAMDASIEGLVEGEFAAEEARLPAQRAAADLYAAAAQVELVG
mgnify:CR=1 FL=1